MYLLSLPGASKRSIASRCRSLPVVRRVTTHREKMNIGDVQPLCFVLFLVLLLIMALHPALCMHASKQASKQPASSIQHLDPPRGGLIITEAMKKRQSREARRNIETPRNIHPQSSRQPQGKLVPETWNALATPATGRHLATSSCSREEHPLPFSASNRRSPV